MGPIGIIIEMPRSDDPARHRQAPEDMLVEAFVAEAAVETFDESVLDRLAPGDVVPVAAAFLLPVQDRMRGQLAAVVADYHRRLLAYRDNGIEFARHPAAGDRGVD